MYKRQLHHHAGGGQGDIAAVIILVQEGGNTLAGSIVVGVHVGDQAQGRLVDVYKRQLYMLGMFMGRVGPVSFALSLTSKPDDNKRKILPVGQINVG